RGSRRSRTASCSTPTTATRPRAASTTSACIRRACSCAAARSRTCSSASPAGRSSTDVEHAFRAYEFFLVQYRRSWRGTVVTSLVNPVFYLSALGIGLGTLVNRGNNLGGLSYVD